MHVATLNSTTFAGYTDWRLPNVQELQSIIDYETFNPSVDPMFNTGCVPACTVTTCSCTVGSSYWCAGGQVPRRDGRGCRVRPPIKQRGD